MGSEGELRGFAQKMPRFRAEMHRGFTCFAQGSGGGKRRESGGSWARNRQGLHAMLVCMVLLRHKGRLCAAKYLFSGGRGGGSVRRAINRLVPSAPAKIGAVALVVLVVAGVGWAAFSSMRAPAFEVHADEAVAPSSSEPEAVEVKAQVYVYVTGAVANPGVYSLDEGLRVCDAVEAAGGLTEDADASTVNLARVLSDGEHIAPAHEGRG